VVKVSGEEATVPSKPIPVAATKGNTKTSSESSED